MSALIGLVVFLIGLAIALLPFTASGTGGRLQCSASMMEAIGEDDDPFNNCREQGTARVVTSAVIASVGVVGAAAGYRIFAPR